MKTFGLPCELTVQILPGLPYEGVAYEDVGAPAGRRLAQAHLVVRVASPAGQAWIGNFAGGERGGVDGVFHTFDPGTILVVADGVGSFVTPNGVAATATVTVMDILADAEHGTMILVDRDAFLECRAADTSIVWRERVVPDELSVDRFVDGVITGRGYDPATGDDVEFTCDAATGAVR